MNALSCVWPNEDAIVKVIGQRSCDQRHQILLTFAIQYGEILPEMLRQKLRGQLKEAATALFGSSYVDNFLHRMLSAEPIDFGSCLFMLVSSTAEDQRKIQKSLIAFIRKSPNVNEELKQWLTELLERVHAVSDNNTEFMAERETAYVNNCSDENFDKVWSHLCTRSHQQLKAIFTKRKENREDLSFDFLTNDKLEMMKILERSHVPDHYMLREVLTSDPLQYDLLVLLIVSIADNNVKQMKKDYRKQFGTKLKHDIKDRVHGNLGDLLLLLVGCRSVCYVILNSYSYSYNK